MSGPIELLRTVLELIPHGVCVFDGDGRVRLVNAAYGAIMDGETLPLGSGGSDAARRHHIRPNGRVIEVQVLPLPDDGEMHVLSDVTALVAAQEDAQRRAATLDAMLANIRHGIVLWDARDRVVAFNPVVEEVLGMEPGLLKAGTTLNEIIDSALQRGNLGTGEVALRRAQFLREQDRSKSHVDQRLTRTGRVFEVRSDPTPDGGFVTTYTDATSIREAEIALRQAKAAAEAANVGKSRFLAAMSHELRTPLSAIREGTDSVARMALDGMGHVGLRPGMDRIVSTSRAVTEATRTLSGVIDTILDVARLEAGRYALADNLVEMGPLIAGCVRGADPAAAAAEVVLLAQLPPHLPAVRGDERRIRQALAHLIGNAVKFTGPLGSVSITARHDPGGPLTVEVADTGAGIADADLEQVFEPFVRATGGPDMPAGTGAGLGLYFSRALLRAHGGDVVLRSRAGHGTAAIMLVPASRVMQQDGTATT